MGLIKSFLRLFTVDYSQRVFTSRQFQQKGYDREIDEGMSSGFKRLATIDISKLEDSEISKLTGEIIEKISDYNVCKVTRLMGFNTKGKRYLTISGEAHLMWVGTASEQIKSHLKLPKNTKYVDYVKMPIKGKPYKTTDLGPYGSTGAPMFGIRKNPEADNLRSKDKIR